MIFNMPVVTFLTFLSWPIIWVVLSFVFYFKMAREDEMTDDSEFTTIQRGGGKA